VERVRIEVDPSALPLSQGSLRCGILTRLKTAPGRIGRSAISVQMSGLPETGHQCATCSAARCPAGTGGAPRAATSVRCGAITQRATDDA